MGCFWNLIKKDLCRFENYNNNQNLFKKFLMAFYYFITNGGFRSIFFYRSKNYFYFKDKKLFYYITSIFGSILSPLEISAQTEIGPGIYFPHPQCIVIGGGKIGKNVSIFQGVTIGLKNELSGYPNIGDNVQISASTTVLGNVKIGNNSVIGVNSVVVNKNIPDNVIAAGIPARILNLRNK